MLREVLRYFSQKLCLSNLCWWSKIGTWWPGEFVYCCFCRGLMRQRNVWWGFLKFWTGIRFCRGSDIAFPNRLKYGPRWIRWRGWFGCRPIKEPTRSLFFCWSPLQTPWNSATQYLKYSDKLIFWFWWFQAAKWCSWFAPKLARSTSRILTCLLLPCTSLTPPKPTNCSRFRNSPDWCLLKLMAGTSPKYFLARMLEISNASLFWMISHQTLLWNSQLQQSTPAPARKLLGPGIKRTRSICLQCSFCWGTCLIACFWAYKWLFQNDGFKMLHRGWFLKFRSRWICLVPRVVVWWRFSWETWKGRRRVFRFWIQRVKTPGKRKWQRTNT